MLTTTTTSTQTAFSCFYTSVRFPKDPLHGPRVTPRIKEQETYTTAPPHYRLERQHSAITFLEKVAVKG